MSRKYAHVGRDGGFRLSYLRSLPTLSVGQADDLKIETETIRVWLSRCGVEDGEPYPNKVTTEHLRNGRWVVYSQHQAEED